MIINVVNRTAKVSVQVYNHLLFCDAAWWTETTVPRKEPRLCPDFKYGTVVGQPDKFVSKIWPTQ